VTDDEDLMIINKSGIVIRMAVSKLRVMGRATQGVKLIDLRGTDEIAAVTKTEHEDEEETEASESVEGPTPDGTEVVEPVEIEIRRSQTPTPEGETTLEQ
jgi:DNA gyrase subunit A